MLLLFFHFLLLYLLLSPSTSPLPGYSTTFAEIIALADSDPKIRTPQKPRTTLIPKVEEIPKAEEK